MDKQLYVNGEDFTPIISADNTVITGLKSDIDTKAAQVDLDAAEAQIATKQDIINSDNKLAFDYVDVETSSEQEIADLFPVIIRSATDFAKALSDGAKSVILASDIQSSAAFVITNSTEIQLNGHKIESTQDCAFKVRSGAEVVISGDGDVVAQECGVAVFDQSKLTVNGGHFTSKDNAIFYTNGSTGRGQNTITINDGTFTGGTESAGYIACGACISNDDTFIINGGTFNITNGIGILARSGNTTIGQNVVINVTGTISGKIGDSSVQIPAGKAIVKDLKSAYPGGAPTVTNNSSYEIYTIE